MAKSKAKRDALDRDYTPRWAARLIADELVGPQFTSIWDPHAGDGSLLGPFIASSFFTTIASDIDPEAPLLRQGIEQAYPGMSQAEALDAGLDADLILCNPPFKHAQELLEGLLTQRPNTTIMALLRLNFLGSQKRVPFWRDNPPTHIHVFPKRLSFRQPDHIPEECRREKAGTDSQEYAVFCWGRGKYVGGKKYDHHVITLGSFNLEAQCS